VLKSRKPPSVRALASPASFKGVLDAPSAAAAVARGLRAGGAAADELPVADGGDGTAEVLRLALGGEWREAAVSDALGRPISARWLLLPDGTAVVEAAAAIGIARLRADELDPLRASSRGLGELIHAALDEEPDALLICLGGSATVDGGAGLLEIIGGLRVPARVACDVANPLLGPRGAARAFGPQKGASPAAVEELERRFAARASLAPYAMLPGAGAAGGLGAALAALGAELVPGGDLVLEAIGFARRLELAELVVTGEGQVDRTTWEGKAPAAVVRAAARAAVRAVVVGGRVVESPPGVETRALSGDPIRTVPDLEAAGLALAAGPK
jgi:glycerate kinase